jgi:hypothetical protein
VSGLLAQTPLVLRLALFVVLVWLGFWFKNSLCVPRLHTVTHASPKLAPRCTAELLRRTGPHTRPYGCLLVEELSERML